MRARLRGDESAARLERREHAGADRVDARARRDVHHVHVDAECRGQAREHRDGARLGLGRAAREPVGVTPRRSGQWPQQRGILGMREQRQAELRDHRHRRAQVGLADVSELVHARGREEALEPERAGGGERLQLARVARHDAAPESGVDRELTRHRAHLLAQRRGGGGRGHAVERHVDDRRHPAGRRRARRGAEALPLGAARLVDVHVGVDDAGQQHEFAQFVGHREPRVPRLDCGDAAVAHDDRGGALAVRQRDASRPHDAVRAAGRSDHFAVQCARASASHPTMNATPPNGVTAPHARTPVPTYA